MPDPLRWGPDNPHPLFRLKTELVWDDSTMSATAAARWTIAGSAMPMQIVAVEMPRKEALAGGQSTLGELKTTMQDDFRNID